jgi:hypothetical protein
MGVAMFSYHARRRNLAPRQAVYRALFCEPGAKDCEPIHVSKAYLGHLRGKRARSVCVEGDKRILVDAGRARVSAPVNEVAAKFLARGDRAAKPIVVRGPAWLLLEEESWFCLWHRLNDNNDLRGKVEPFVRGDHLVETVRFPDNGDIAVWQRWLFRNEEDFVAASGLTGMQACEDVELPKGADVKLPTDADGFSEA